MNVKIIKFGENAKKISNQVWEGTCHHCGTEMDITQQEIIKCRNGSSLNVQGEDINQVDCPICGTNTFFTVKP